MQKYLLLSLLILLFSSHVRARHNLDSLRFQAMILKDTQMLNSILDSNLIYIHSNGLLEFKSDMLYSISKGKIVYRKAVFLERILFLHSQTKRVFRGRVLITGTYEGHEFEVKLAFTSMYHCTKKGCKLVYWQSTKMKE